MFSEYINKKKSGHGITNQELSDRSGVPKGTVDRLLAKDGDSCNLETAVALVRAVNGSLDEAMGIIHPAVEVNEGKLTEDGYTESEIRAILRWAGSEIARNYQSVVAGLEARIAEKDQRISHRSEMLEDEHRRASEQIEDMRRRAHDEIAYERHRARICLVVSYLALGIIVCLFAADYLIPTMGWLQR